MVFDFALTAMVDIPSPNPILSPLVIFASEDRPFRGVVSEVICGERWWSAGPRYLSRDPM